MANWQYTYIMSHHITLGSRLLKAEKEVTTETFSSFFIQKFKVFNISNASASQKSCKGLGNFKKKFKTKKEKPHITKVTWQCSAKIETRRED